ncbi:MAG: repair protein RecN [Candidatus Midichloriaceae bacterium]|jgi:DNA repair protein RecN (Recombination protein N)|nr:repair protein RecN [Candidatus Midichloriaceae bacterium]
MLNSIAIKDFLLIDDIEISFKNSFTVITGETGAGKSIIIQALMIALGDKVSNKKLIRPGAKNAIITANFDIAGYKSVLEVLSNLGIETEDEIIVRRVIYQDGKSKAYINDIPVNISSLAQLKDVMLEVCGQHSSRSLLEKSNHLKLLDEYAGCTEKVRNLAALYTNLKNKSLELAALQKKKEVSDIERDFLNSTIKELENANVHPNEEDDLIEKRKSMADRHKLSEILIKTNQKITSLNLESQLYNLQKDLERGGEIFEKATTALKNAMSEVKEFEAQIEELASLFSNDFDMEKLESRLFKIRSIARKYGVVSSEISSFLEAKKAELNEIDNLEYLIKKAEGEVRGAKDSYLNLAQEVTEIRRKAALLLEDKIEAHLADLKMEKVEILIDVQSTDNPDEWTSTGIDKISFMVRTNKGMDFGDIAKSASGGELSRIMLSVKLALSEKNSAEIIIFDEIDTGISGSVSSAVGKKLHLLAASSQVIAITHQPQVAAFGQNHIHVAKFSNDNATSVKIDVLNQEQQLNEIARMISGEKITQASLEAAVSLFKEANAQAI